MSRPGREDRSKRLQSMQIGAWGSFSQEYVRLCNLLFEQSAAYANEHKGNVSPYTFAGVPLLFSALRAFLIECASGMYEWSNGEDKALLDRLAADANEIALLKESYTLPSGLLCDLGLLYEVRNEMIHPAHRPTGTRDQTPEYLRALKERGLLQSSGDPNSDYPWMHQLQSHRLFEWAFVIIEQVATVLVERHHEDKNMGRNYLASYSRFRAVRL